MSDEIRADYEELEQLSKRFDQGASEIARMLANIKRSMDPLQNGGWIGRGSKAFFSEMNGEVLPASRRLHDALEEASDVTARIAQQMKQAEEEASGLFKHSA